MSFDGAVGGMLALLTRRGNAGGHFDGYGIVAELGDEDLAIDMNGWIDAKPNARRHDGAIGMAAAGQDRKRCLAPTFRMMT
jgi:hypothetical protein